MRLRAVFAITGIVALGWAVVWGQAAGGGASAGAKQPFGLAPEDGYLSPTHYTNAYFGFQIDLPAGLGLHALPQPSSGDRRIQVLELIGASSSRASFSISAYEYKNKNYTDAKSQLRKMLDQEVFYGVEQMKPLSKIPVGDRMFYAYEIRKGQDLHGAIAAEMNGYVVVLEMRSTSAEVMQSMRAAVLGMEFFPPAEARQRAGSGAEEYQGPAISDEHMRYVRQTRPADRIPVGKVAGSEYVNRELGFTYEIPAAWTVQPEGAIEPAVERYRERVLGEPLVGTRERVVIKACRKTLLSVWRTLPGVDGQVPYDEFGEATLTAMPLACFPNIRFPEDVKDPTAVREFIAGLRLTQPLQRDMTDATSYVRAGKMFVVTHGVIAYKEKSEGLSRRVSVAMVMTEQRGYLLIWLFCAPHESELRELMATKVSFENTMAEAPANKVPASAASPATQAAPEAEKKLTPPAVSPMSQPEYRPSLGPAADDAAPQAGQTKQSGGQAAPH